MNEPFFSIVIPSFQTPPDQLVRALECLFSQSFADWEAVVVDDASDISVETILKTSETDRNSQIRILRHERNKGTHSARRTGALTSRGRWILFLDADDTLAPAALETIAGRLRNAPNDLDMLRFGVSIINTSGSVETRMPIVENGKTCLARVFPRRVGVFGPICSGAYRGTICRRAFSRMEDIRLLYGEDAYELFAIAAFSSRLDVVPNAIYEYDRTRRGVTGWQNDRDDFAVYYRSFLLAMRERLASFAATARFARSLPGDEGKTARRAMWRRRNVLLLAMYPFEASFLRAQGIPLCRILGDLKSALAPLSPFDRFLFRAGQIARVWREQLHLAPKRTKANWKAPVRVGTTELAAPIRVSERARPFYAFWWIHPDGFHNFGDEITPFLLAHVSTGLDIRRVDFQRMPQASTLGFAWKAIRNGWFSDRSSRQRVFRIGSVHFCIGSIFRLVPKRAIVWGTGVGTGGERICYRRLDIRALRGPESLKRLREAGFPVGDIPLGDPALLMPLVLPRPRHEPLFDFGIVPHYVDYDDFATRCDPYPCFDLKTADVESIVWRLWQCRVVISSSLHGLIVSHAYGIPAVWMKSGRFCKDNFKFKDYFASVGIPFYEPVSANQSVERIVEEARKRMAFSLPRFDVKRIQSDLLSVAPFPVKPSVMDGL